MSFTLPSFVPYAGCEGHWVSNYDYKNKGKSFGYFQCNYCTKNWMSAHSQKSFKQACKSCDRYFLPAFLWVNDFKNEKTNENALEDKNKPHRSDLC